MGDYLWIATGVGISALLFCGHLVIAARQRKRLLGQLPELLDLLIPSLHNGTDVETALGIAADMGPFQTKTLLSKLHRKLKLADSIEPILDQFANSFCTFETDYLATAIKTQRNDLPVFQESLDRLESLREASSSLSQKSRSFPQLNKWLIYIFLVLWPAIVLGMMLTQPQYFQKLVTHPVGRVLLPGALCLQIAGGIWAIALVKRAEKNQSASI